MKGFEGGQGRNGQRVNIFCILSLTLKHRTFLMIKLKKKSLYLSNYYFYTHKVLNNIVWIIFIVIKIDILNQNY